MTEFVLEDTDRYWWPVVVRVPDPENPGKFLNQTLEMEFELQDRDEIIKQEKILSELYDPQARVDHEKEQLRKVCKNWRSSKDRSKQPAPFTEENFNRAIQKTWFRIGVYEALRQSQMGEEARLGN